MLFVQMAEMVGGLIPVISESCFCVMSFMASRTFSLNFTGMLLHSFQIYNTTIFVKNQYEKSYFNYVKRIDKLRDA